MQTIKGTAQVIANNDSLTKASPASSIATRESRRSLSKKRKSDEICHDQTDFLAAVPPDKKRPRNTWLR